ncbi:hypothetical protein PHISCL_01654 [Aspergillus sclerotialis]|uniref:Uncharacterized protein n=1 Tax=Aspergillus sclerotialis TaxID=2070753 RepID=A0A3A2ZS38_9EURO|nr:hypothetical protein PHISCL_01654 [Aspergillus sclerotialis]
MKLFSDISHKFFENGGLTVPEVSGIIAAGVFIVQYLIPLALPIILLALLKEKDSIATAPAITWSVVGQFLQSSLWPVILSADSSATTGVPKRIIVVTRLKTLLAVLIAIAAVVTPMGLYERIIASDSPTPSAFHYVEDGSTFGLGTPPRTDLPFSRFCGAMHLVACPNSFSNVTTFSNATGDYYHVENYDTRVPQYVIHAFQSGLSAFNKSVSSVFDIQSRYYSWSRKTKSPDPLRPDNGSSYPTSGFRPIESIILKDKVTLVEGLIVDMVNGGIGFRNHSAPPVKGFGSEWSEDILFVVPESECVDTNITIDFTLPTYYSDTDSITNMVLTDHGGFAHITKEYPKVDVSDAQNNPNLRARAYKAAWTNNAYSMAFMNITSVKTENDSNSHAFEYLNSEVGKQFPLKGNGSSIGSSIIVDPYSIQSSGSYGAYLNGLDQGMDAYNYTNIFNTSENITNPSKPPLYPNPFRITSREFSSISTVCRGAGAADVANISHIAAQCGLLLGTPRRQDGTSSLLFYPGTNWSVPLYSCISTTKAVIKNVHFLFNGSDDLSGVTVTGLADKVYKDDSSKPLWGVEKTGMNLTDVNPIWGLVSSSNQGNISLSTIRKESLYLPGYVGWGDVSTFGEIRNLPGVHFHLDALSSTYKISSGPSDMDYTGKSSLALFQKWQTYTRDAESAKNVPNLVWTDLAANSVLGTRGMHTQSKDNSIQKRAESDKDNLYPVTTYHQRIRYHLPYAIPAIIVLVLTAVILLFTLLSCLRRSGINKMDRFLKKTSQARILTARLYGTSSPSEYDKVRGKEASPSSAKKAWRDTMGRKEITLSAQQEQVVIHDARYSERSEPLLQENPVYLSNM